MSSFACLFQVEELFVCVKMRMSWRFRVNVRLTSKKFAIYVIVRILLEFRSWSKQKRKSSRRTKTKAITIFCQSYQAISTFKINIILRYYKSYFLLINQYCELSQTFLFHKFVNTDCMQTRIVSSLCQRVVDVISSSRENLVNTIEYTISSFFDIILKRQKQPHLWRRIE
jgi:hypothetical protein